MANFQSPYGMQPVTVTGSTYDTGGYWEYPLTTNNTAAIGVGEPVGMVNGSIVSLTTSPTSTLSSTGTPIGVCMGCSYDDPSLGFVNRQVLPANAVTSGFKNIKIKVADNPDYVFRIQADGPVAATKLGCVGGLTTTYLAGGANATSAMINALGSSKACASATSFTNAPGNPYPALRIIGFATNPGSSPGDLFTDLIVRWNFTVHVYNQPSTL